MHTYLYYFRLSLSLSLTLRPNVVQKSHCKHAAKDETK